MLQYKAPARVQSHRRGFTLVELLVVIGLLLVLTGLGLLIVPSINAEQQATQAASQVQQWLEIAKQRAGRDRAPRGVRLLAGTAIPLQVTQLEFIEQPPDYFLGAGSTFSTGLSATSKLPVVNFVGGTTNLTGGHGNPKKFLPSVPTGMPDPNAGLYPVQPGDRITLGGSEEIHTILAVSDVLQLTLVPPPPNGTGYTPSTFTSATQYRIIRQPRTIGDDPLQMPANIIIDLAPRGLGFDLSGFMTTAGHIDILFSPSGQVIGQMAGLDKIILWVRASTVPDGQNDPTLVCVYPRTGLVAACQVDVPFLTTAPYTFTANGRRSSQ